MCVIAFRIKALYNERQSIKMKEEFAMILNGLKRAIILVILVVFSAISMTGCGDKKVMQVEVIQGFDEVAPVESEPVILREEHTEITDDIETQERIEAESEQNLIPFVDRGVTDRDYQIESAIYENGVVKITYPQFRNMEDTVFQDKINADIMAAAIAGADNEELTSYTLSFETADAGSEAVSFVFKGYQYQNGAAYPQNIVKTININIETGESVRLTDYCDLSNVVSCLENQTGYRIVSDGIDSDDFSAFLNNGYVTDYAMTLLDFDLDFQNQAFVPTGYSAIRNNHLVLFIWTEHALGDYVEIVFDEDL